MRTKLLHLYRRKINCKYFHTLEVKETNKVISTSNPYHPEATEVIDVRSPDEFKQDHIPNAINLPVLNNTERAEVGKLYAVDPFSARKNGAQLVVSNMSEILKNHVQDKDRDYKPLVYCWRGGQRSRSFATILSEIGFDVLLLDKGYRAYRKKVIEELNILPDRFSYRVITGLTGTGKTQILHRLSEKGEQILDLEGLANHKGSMLGRHPTEEQTTQKYFDSLLLQKLMSFDETKVVWMESESRNIGKCSIPGVLFKHLCHSKRYCINLPLNERAKHIIRDYPYWLEDPENLNKILEFLKRYCGNDNVEYWKSLIQKREWETFVESILIHHYDPTYTKSQTKNQLTNDIVDIQYSDMTENSLQTLIDKLIHLK